MKVESTDTKPDDSCDILRPQHERKIIGSRKCCLSYKHENEKLKREIAILNYVARQKKGSNQ